MASVFTCLFYQFLSEVCHSHYCDGFVSSCGSFCFGSTQRRHLIRCMENLNHRAFGETNLLLS